MSRQRLNLPVSADHPAYPGHFPGQPILPGVVLLDEAMHAMSGHAGIDLGCCHVSSVKFLSPVGPGEALHVEYELQAGQALRFDIFAGERRVATGALKPREV